MVMESNYSPVEALMSVAPLITTSSTKMRIQIFRHQIPSILNNLGKISDAPCTTCQHTLAQRLV